MLHSLRALAHHSASHTLPSSTLPVALSPPITREFIEQLKQRVSADTRAEFASLLKQRNTESIAKMREKQDEMVITVMESLRPTLQLQQMVLDYVGADDKQRHLGGGEDHDIEGVESDVRTLYA